MKKIITIIILLFCCMQEACYAAITMKEVVETGLIQNPRLKEEKAKLGISDAEIKEAALFINPRIILEATLADNSYKSGIGQTFELGGKRKKRILAAKAEKEVVFEQIANEIIKTRSAIKDAYIDLYIAKEQISLADKILKITEKLSEIASKQEKAGQIALLDVLQAETVNIKAKNEIQSAQLDLNRAFNTLNSLIGDTLNTNIDIQKPSENEDFQIVSYINNREQENVIRNLIETAYKNNHVLKSLEKSIEKTKYLEKLAKASIYPDISFAAGPNINVEKDDKTTTRVNLFASLEMDLPIFNHGQANLMKAKANSVLLEKRLNTEKASLKLEIENTYSEIKQNEKILKAYEEEIIPKSIDILHKAELSFEEGKSNIIIPLNAQQAFIDSQKGYIKTLSSYYKSLNKLEKIIGVDNESL